MPGYQKGIKICATCSYWGGARTLYGTHKLCKIDNNNEKGYCSQLRNTRMAISTCSKWEKWPSLK